jgi:hypothetical protein
MTSLEQKILACSTVLRPDLHERQALRRLMRGVKDVDLIIDMAIKEGLVCMLYKSLLKSGALDAMNRPQRQRLQSLYYQTLVHNLRLIHDLKQILPELKKRQIQVVLLQGISLLQQVYDDVGLRPMTDIDLWVLKRDYSDFIGVLIKCGYQGDRLYPHTFRKGPTTLDLHTHILGADRIRTRTLLLAKSQDCIYHQTRVIEFEGEKVRCLGECDQVLYLCLHALKHNAERLMWLADIKNLVEDWRQPDWKALIDRARELGQEKSVFSVYFLLYHLLHFHCPKEVRQVLERKRPGFMEKRVLSQRITKGSLPVWAHLLLFSPPKGLHKTIPYLLETLFPRPAILRQIFDDSPGSKVWELYLMRLLALLGKVRMSVRG